jgi:hypothetical protein
MNSCFKTHALTVLLLSAMLINKVSAKETVSNENLKPELSSQFKDSESIKSDPGQAHSKEEGASAEAKKEALPPCKGSYSKIAWTECVGTKKQYNGPHFVGDSYEGEFKEGRPHGKGEMKYLDGHRFVGIFEMGVRDGPGAEYDKKDNLIVQGYWRAGVLVKVIQGSEASLSAHEEPRESHQGANKK